MNELIIFKFAIKPLVGLMYKYLDFIQKNKIKFDNSWGKSRAYEKII